MGNFTMLRIYHPVGQGAFYTEYIYEKNFHVIYDCGCDHTARYSNRIDDLIKGALSGIDTIDILFISHFHYDHISKIPLLLDLEKKIKRVVLPYLHEDEKILFMLFYKALGYSELEKLVGSPEAFFEEVTTIHTVLPYEGGEGKDEGGGLIDLDTNNQKTIRSGAKLTTAELKSLNWVYIPYNFKNYEWAKKVKDELNKKGIKHERIKEGNLEGLTKEDKKKIKKIYEKVIRDLNVGSLVVYSGPSSNASFSVTIKSIPSRFPCYCHRIDYMSCWRYASYSRYYDCEEFFEDLRQLYKYRCYEYYPYKKPSCIYTGDYDLKKKDLSEVFKAYWRTVGTIQIPHHGSDKNFNKRIIKPYTFYPISFGLKNKYGHPSIRVFCKITLRDGFPVSITESPCSAFIQCISLVN